MIKKIGNGTSDFSLNKIQLGRPYVHTHNKINFQLSRSEKQNLTPYTNILRARLLQSTVQSDIHGVEQ